MSKDLFYEMRDEMRSGAFYNHEEDSSSYWNKGNLMCTTQWDSLDVNFIYNLKSEDRLKLIRAMQDQRNEYLVESKKQYNKYLIVFILAIAVFFLGGLALAYAQRSVDTDIVYVEDKSKYFEDNDCSVRAYAEVFDISYSEAREDLKSSGRKRGNPMALKDFIKHIFTYKRGSLKDVTYLDYYSDNVKSSDFIEHYAEDGYSYITISEGHVFAIEQDTDGVWVVKGNAKDKYLRILGWMKFKSRLV